MVLLFVAILTFGLAIAIWLAVRRRKPAWRIPGAVGAGFLCCAGGLILVAFLFGSLMCGSYDFPTVMSPDGHRVASVSEEDCGAVDHFHSEVRIKESTSFLGVRNGGTVFTIADDPRILEITWVGPQELFIRYPDNSRYPQEFSCKERWKDIKITCISFPREFEKQLQEMPPVKRGIW